MNKYQVVMPNGDIAKIAADRMENSEGDLRFFVGNEQVGEFRYWHAWNLLGKVDALEVSSSPTPSDPAMAYVDATIKRLIEQ